MQKLFASLFALGASVALIGSASAAPSQASFDGTWNVRLVTEAGQCDESYSYTIAIADGQVRPVGAAASVSGGVSGDGSVTLGVQRSIARAEGSGRLRAKSGSGTWRLSMLGCTGRWTARRAA
jgi:hypothetical protein